MKVLFSTVIRGAPVNQGGELVSLDWETKKVESRISIYPCDPEIDDPNPRGNSRGGRGIAILDDGRIVVSSYHSLYILSPDFRILSKVSHPLMVGLHEVYLASRKYIWVTSTAIDAALKIDLETGDLVQGIWPREISSFQHKLGLVSLEIDKKADNRSKYLTKKHTLHPSHLHLNAITKWHNEVYALFHNLGIIVNLEREKIIIQDKRLKGSHNLVVKDDNLFVNNTYGKSILVYDLESKRFVKQMNLTKFPKVKKLVGFSSKIKYYREIVSKLIGSTQSIVARPYFIRGLDIIDNLLFVGLSPASILCLNLDNEKLLDVFQYSRDTHVSVHGLKVQG